MSALCLRTTIISTAVALCMLPGWPASAQDSRQNEPGQFDFYLLTLSWSPSFCEASAERSSRTNRDEQNADRQASAQTPGGDAQAQSDAAAIRLAATIAAAATSSAVIGPTRSWCTGCGRNTSAGFPSSAKPRHRASIATSCRQCSI